MSDFLNMCAALSTKTNDCAMPLSVNLQGHRKCYAELPSKVAACVSHHELQNVPWAVQADARRQAPFVTYALCAAAEALQAADWHPANSEDKGATGVAIGVGMSSTQDIADAGVLVSQVLTAPLNVLHALVDSHLNGLVHRCDMLVFHCVLLLA